MMVIDRGKRLEHTTTSSTSMGEEVGVGSDDGGYRESYIYAFLCKTVKTYLLTEDKGGRCRILCSSPSPDGHQEYHYHMESHGTIAHQRQCHLTKGVHEASNRQHLSSSKQKWENDDIRMTQ